MNLRVAILFSVSCALSHAQAIPTADLLYDDFTKDVSLDQSRWLINTPLLSSLASSMIRGIPMSLVFPRLTFSSAGMTLSGVNARGQFAGLQSKQLFTPPFTVQASVKGLEAHANPFALLLATADGSQILNLFGNINPANGGVYKIGINTRTEGVQVLDPRPSVNKWYKLIIAVDASGQAGAILEDGAGRTIGSARGFHFGTRPVYVLIAQDEPSPIAVGPNSAIWGEILITRGALSQGIDNLSAPSVPTEISRSPTTTAPPSNSNRTLPLANTNLPVIVTTTRFNLNGVWRDMSPNEEGPGSISPGVDNSMFRIALGQAPNIRIIQQGDNVSAIPDLDPRLTKTFFRGKYRTDQLIAGEATSKDSTPQIDRWVEANLHVVDPDHIRLSSADSSDAGGMMVRISVARPGDAVCDSNTHTDGLHAFQRGSAIVNGKSPNYDAARCWLSIGAANNESGSQAYLAILLMEESPAAKDPLYHLVQDPALAFTLASKSAAQDNVLGELLLADMYKKGHCTNIDIDKGNYWYSRGLEQQWIDTEIRKSIGPSMATPQLPNAMTLAGVLASIALDPDNEIDPLYNSIDSQSCRDRRWNDCSRDRAIAEDKRQRDHERFIERRGERAQELQTKKARLDKDCYARMRGACELAKEIGEKMAQDH
jgi:hypothetical protein